MDSLGLRPTSFAYPYGGPYWFTDFLILERFKVIRKVAAKSSMVPITDVDEIFSDGDDSIVKALGFDHITRLTRADIDAAIKRVKEKNEIVSLYSHYPNPDTTDSYSFDPVLLEYILEAATDNNLKFYTASELNK